MVPVEITKLAASGLTWWWRGTPASPDFVMPITPR
jgi:hypothetical protein